jgi:hypothetical protein
MHSSLKCNQDARLDGVRIGADVPHGRTHGTHSTWSDGKRWPTVWRCGDSELSEGSSRAWSLTSVLPTTGLGQAATCRDTGVIPFFGSDQSDGRRSLEVHSWTGLGPFVPIFSTGTWGPVVNDAAKSSDLESWTLVTWGPWGCPHVLGRWSCLATTVPTRQGS